MMTKACCSALPYSKNIHDLLDSLCHYIAPFKPLDYNLQFLNLNPFGKATWSPSPSSRYASNAAQTRTPVTAKSLVRL